MLVMKDKIESLKHYEKNKKKIMEDSDAVILPSDQAKAKLSREAINRTLKT